MEIKSLSSAQRLRYSYCTVIVQLLNSYSVVFVNAAVEKRVFGEGETDGRTDMRTHPFTEMR